MNDVYQGTFPAEKIFLRRGRLDGGCCESEGQAFGLMRMLEDTDPVFSENIVFVDFCGGLKQAGPIFTEVVVTCHRCNGSVMRVAHMKVGILPSSGE